MYKNRHKSSLSKMASKQMAKVSKKSSTHSIRDTPEETTRTRTLSDVRADLKQLERQERYMCDICGQEGLSDTDMRSHVLLEHVESQISCPFCDLEGTTLEEMTLHVNSQHLDILTPSEEEPGMEFKENISNNPENIKLSVNSYVNCHELRSPEEYITNNLQQNYLEKDDVKKLVNNCRSESEMDCNENDENLSSPSTSTSSSNNNSTPKRARLFLEVPKVIVDKPQPNSAKKSQTILRSSSIENNTSPNYSCPLCGWGSDLSEEITHHVNVAHLDALTPTKVTGPLGPGDRQNNNITGPLECPLCGWSTTDGASLERHVHHSHREELGSPGAGSLGQLTPESSLICPVCGIECEDTNDLMAHVDGHFSNQHTPGSEPETYDNVLAQELQQQQQEVARKKEQQDFEQLQEQYGVKGNNNYKKQAEKNMEKAVNKGQMSITDFYIKRSQVQQADSSGVDDGHSSSKGIIESLHKYYRGIPSGISEYHLCSPADHFAASYGDKGWGCGYRNLQMLLSSLSMYDQYQQALFNGRPVIPSIPKIQRLIETAWQKGFDHAGCEQLGGKVVGTSKWIGATEIVATLSSLKVKCQLVDFHTPTGPGGTHPRLLEWVKDYFSGTEDKFKAPLYLQHQGHSRTIIGIERQKDGSQRLLLFDPSCSRPQMNQFLQTITANLMRTLRRPIYSLKARQYQIVAVRGILTDTEFQESKMLKSEQVP